MLCNRYVNTYGFSDGFDLTGGFQKSKCVSHDAVNNADSKENQGLAITGVGTVDCSRHDMKRPNSMVTLKAGER